MDDLLIPGPSTEAVDSLVDYGETILKIFSYHINDVDKAGQEFRADTKTLDSQAGQYVAIFGYQPGIQYR